MKLGKVVQLQIRSHKKFIIPIVLLIILNALLRLPSFSSPLYLDDESLYLTIGRSVSAGSRLYTDVRDLHIARLPLFYLLYAFAGNHITIRLFALFANTVSIILLFTINHWISKSISKASFLTLIFVIFSSTPVFDGVHPYAEIFFLPFVFGSIYILLVQESGLKSVHNKQYVYLISGLLLGLGVLIKIHVVFEIMAVAVYFVTEGLLVKNEKKYAVRKMFLFLIGVIAPIVFTISLLYLKHDVYVGNFVNLLRLGINMPQYAASSIGLDMIYSTRFKLLLLGGCVFLVQLFARRVEDGSIRLIVLISIFSLISSVLLNYYGHHYALQSLTILLPIALLISRRDFVAKLFALLPLGMLVLVLFVYQSGFNIIHTVSYYRTYHAFHTGKMSNDAYMLSFSSLAPRNIKLSRYINEIAKNNEKILLWGMSSEVYVLSNTLPVGKYIWSEHIEFLNAYNDLIRKAEEDQARIAVLFDETPHASVLIEEYIEKNFRLVKIISDEYNKSSARVYSRI